MAEVRVQDVVDQNLSVGDLSPSDAPATTSTSDYPGSGDAISANEGAIKENGLHTPSLVRMDDLEDASGRSDTDTSRADGSVAGDRTAEPKLVKKIGSKPVSFAKYSVPKVIAASASVKNADKVLISSTSSSSQQLVGRPRLVAKTTSSLQPKVKPFKAAAPDPMQVWNKNRVTPQPSTKNLTDEELKQQYGIHLTSRLQDDGDGKEAKWADIDDDEDDWAPETIEWNDGTKTTLTATDIAPTAILKPHPDTLPEQPVQPQPSKLVAPQFTSSIGPNATVLKLGASAERQHAQKAAEKQSRSPLENSALSGSKSSPAPTPAKSPWAPLPPVDKISPVSINPQPMQPPARFPGPGYGQPVAGFAAPSPAKEISADDFNRSWRDSVSGQPRELYMPNSGRYEAVAEGRRRMSKNDHNFRAPAVLQRPNQTDTHAPAEPSAAFQTSRTSADSRRRASSTISGGSGQFVRRMSIKSGEGHAPVFDLQPQEPQVQETSVRPDSSNGPPSQTQTPTYQARVHPTDYISASGPIPSQYDLEAQRVQQRALMKENIERARQRKLEEEARMEAEKQERIKLKLASLGDPKTEKAKSDESGPAAEKGAIQDSAASIGSVTVSNHSPPKPPQPLATGEPQQYGMMKVHALDTVKKISPPLSQQPEGHRASGLVKTDTSNQENTTPNGLRLTSENQRQSHPDSLAALNQSPRLSKPVSSGSDARSGWGDAHRPAGSLWGLPNNKALGNGTFDQSLAGYAPQDLSRTPTTVQGWMSGRAPTTGKSPQPQYAHHQATEDRSHPAHPVSSPDQAPLAVDSEVDSLFPTTRPAPIGPPQALSAQPLVNGYPTMPNTNGGVAAWNNFHQVASQTERAESEKYQRELAAKREEEVRTGIRHGPQYTFNETWKQVSLGEQVGQRSVASVNQTTIVPPQAFGAVGTIPGSETSPRVVNGQPGRGSRFFPHNNSGHPLQDRRSVTYSHPEVSRTPSPPPAEEYASLHPAFDGDLSHPAVRFPRERAVVKLPPAMPPTPPEPVQASAAPQPEQPLTWAARVSMPAPNATPPLRSVSTPIVQNPSWQERFNGLLGKKTSPIRHTVQLVEGVLEVAPSTREPLDVMPHVFSAAVSLPQYVEIDMQGADQVTSKDVEDEEDLFEDRELASLPAVKLPHNAQPVQFPLAEPPHKLSPMVDPTTISHFMVNNAYERHFQKPQFAIIHMPFSTQSIRKDIPLKGGVSQHAHPRSRNVSGAHTGKHGRFSRGLKPRQTSKAH